MRAVRPHLHAGSLSSESETSTYREQSTKELYRDEEKRRILQFAFQHNLDVGYATAGCIWRKAANEPCRRPGCNPAGGSDKDKSRKRVIVRPNNQSVAPQICIS
jgi:hypothetical protein